MSDFDPNNPSGSEGDDLGGLAWNEFDWEHFLREQDDIVLRYIGFYELMERDDTERLEKVARHMGWALEADDLSEDDEDDSDEDPEGEPYTIHKNYIYVATKAIFLKLARAWENIAGQPTLVPQPLAVAFMSAIQRAESHAMIAVHALDFGDFTMAVSLFKRAFAEINRAIAFMNDANAKFSPTLEKFRGDALPMLFDLREISLRMMRDCRNAVESTTDDDSE